jgi:hypothetical protein
MLTLFKGHGEQFPILDSRSLTEVRKTSCKDGIRIPAELQTTGHQFLRSLEQMPLPCPRISSTEMSHFGSGLVSSCEAWEPVALSQPPV